MLSKVRYFIFVLAFLFLTACGGGGNSSAVVNDAVTAPATDTATDMSVDTTSGGGDPLGVVGTTEEEQDRLFASLTENVISPRYAELQDDAEDLQDVINTYCADPVNGDSALLETAWVDAMQAWQAIELVRFGPIEEEFRRLRIQFFEGDGNVVVSDVLALLDSSQALSEEVIAASPFSTQGLPAIEVWMNL